MPKISRISGTSQRRRHLNARWKEHDSLETWITVMEKATESDFLNGRVKRFRASFDWIIKSGDNFIKVLEGNYDDRDDGQQDKNLTIERFNEEYYPLQTNEDLEYWIERGVINKNQRGRL